METQQRKHIKSKKLLQAVLNYCLENEVAFAMWRLPQANQIQIIGDQHGGTLLSNIDFDALDSGFLISQFNNEKPSVFLNEDFKATITLAYRKENTVELENEIIWEKEFPDAEEKLLFNSSSNLKNLPLIETNNEDSKNRYLDVVRKGIQLIKEGVFEKVVPSRIKTNNYKDIPNLIDAFLESCHRYPSAFTNLHYSKHSGLWFGASPETLIEHQEDDYFKTVALAGTQAAEDGKSIVETSWTQKEIEEQAYVSRYIINCFKKIRLREFKEVGPKTVKAGNLLHLKTYFEIDLKSLNFPELPAVMLRLLHPTSAVCGMPKKESLEFLLRYESHDRSFFSGYLGPVKQNGYSHLFVNLRCCQLSRDKVIFYAGAGITEDSLPEKEWLETEMKCNILSSILFPN